MYQVEALGELAKGVQMRDAAGRVVATFHGASWSGRCQVTAGSQVYRYRLTGFRSCRLDAAAGGSVVTMRKTKWWSVRWVVDVGPVRYGLRRVRPLRRSWELRLGGSRVGLIAPVSLRNVPATADFPADFPLAAAVTVVAVVLQPLWHSVD